MTTSQSYLAKGEYPPDWKEISRHRREDIAGDQCEWIESDGSRCPRRQYDPIPGSKNPYAKTVLTVAHLNHDPIDCRPENLRAWCQAHHLRYDAQMHAQHARETRQRKRHEQAIDAGQATWLEGDIA